jgi:hypothetical protein
MIRPSADLQIWVEIAIGSIDFQAIDDLRDGCGLAIHMVDAVTGKLISESTSYQHFDQVPDYFPSGVLVLDSSSLLCCE